MARRSDNPSMTQGLVKLLENYVSGQISDRRWQRIMEVLDSGILNRQERLEYIAALNEGFVNRRYGRRS